MGQQLWRLRFASAGKCGKPHQWLSSSQPLAGVPGKPDVRLRGQFACAMAQSETSWAQESAARPHFAARRLMLGASYTETLRIKHPTFLSLLRTHMDNRPEQIPTEQAVPDDEELVSVLDTKEQSEAMVVRGLL